MTTATTVNVQFQLRADTAANWTAANPILLVNEFALETDTKKLKVGDGTTAWASLAYFPSIVTGGTVLGNLEIGSTGTLTFEGSTANDFETTLAVTDPTADRTITLPDQSGTVVVSGNASIVDADIAAGAGIAVSKLANGTANQVLVTDGTDVSWSDDLTLAGNLTVNGTTTTVNTETLVVEDKNIELGVVDTPTDVTADGGGITLKGTTDKTINWIDATDSWTSSENIDLANGKSYRINDTEVLSATTLGSGVTSSSLTSVGTLGSVTVTNDATAGMFIPTGGTAPSNGLYLPTANSVALSTSGTGKLFIDSSGRLLVGTSTSSAVATQVLQGNSSATTGNSRLILANGTTTPSTLGDIVFSDSGHTNSAFIRGAKDSGTWTTGVSQPSLLGFYTTPDSTATPVASLFIRANGKLESDTTYLATTANAANLHIDSGGFFLRSTSSAKYKTDVETLQDSYSDAILGIRPVWYRSICENDKPAHSWWGFIAEEVAAIDPRLVQWKTVDVSYDENGAPVQKPCDPEPDGVAYERFVPHLLNLIKRQKEQIEAMESRLTALEQS